MPYIVVKAYPKDEETKKRVVDKINQIFLEEWGCPQQAITILLEEVTPDDWADKVFRPEIEPKKDKMMILDGEKRYK